MADVLWLGTEACNDPFMVGGKAANLSRLAGEFRVPPGFAVAGLVPEADGLPPNVRSAVGAAYRTLAERIDEPTPSVAVRSSALDEDGATASFAGSTRRF